MLSQHTEPASARSDEGSIQRATTAQQPQIHEPLRVLVDACHQETPARHSTDTARRESFATPHTSPGRGLSHSQSLGSNAGVHRHGPIASPLSSHEYVPSPGTDSSTCTRLAPLSWFELLAHDAANADRDFLLSPPQRVPSTLAPGSSVGPVQSPTLQPHNQRERESFQAASFQRVPEIDAKLVAPPVGDPSTALPDESSSWCTVVPIELSDQEHFMFSHFVRTLGAWLDFFDPSLQLSTVLPHLALRNTGLMNALLALSARNLSLYNETDEHQGDPLAAEKNGTSNPGDTEQDMASRIDRNIAVQYYYETLHYLNKAMHYPSYTRSPELLCTALLISTYEMIDGSNYDWERHLKGVFWIQRFQNNDGESGGVRQAVWWAWLRQDVWVAMRERRRVFSFFQPRKHISMLTAPELTCRAHYLLSQCVNYASREESESTDIQQRLERGNELLFMLQEWQNYLPREFSPLPIKQSSDIFPSIWIHPPPYAAAVQLHSLARILVVLHRPSIGGLQDYRAAQSLLASSVSTVCGIARTIRSDDMPASLVSLNCLFGGNLSGLFLKMICTNIRFCSRNERSCPS